MKSPSNLNQPIICCKDLFDQMGQGYILLEVIFDAERPIDLLYIETNAAADRMIGAQLAGKRTLEIGPNDEPQWFDIMSRIAVTGISERHELSPTPQGLYFTFYAFKVGGVEEHKVAVIYQQVTERRHITEQLRRSEEQFRSFITASSSMVYKMSADWKYMFTLDGKNILTDTNDPTGDWTEKYIPKIDRTLVWQTIRQAIANKTIFELEHRVLQAGGSIGWVFSRAIPVIDEKGNIAEWLGAGSDITERKLAESELIKNEEKYRILFDSIDEGFNIIEVIMNEQGQAVDIVYQEVNPAFSRMTGLLQNVVGKRVRDVVSDLEQHWFEMYGRVVMTGKPERYEEYSGVLDKWFSAYVSLAGGAGSRIITVVFNDITERKRAEGNLALLAQISEDLVSLTNIDQTMSVLGERLAKYFGLSACAFAELSADAKTAIINHNWHKSDMPSLLGTYKMDEFVSPKVLRLCKEGEAVVVRNVHTDPNTEGGQYDVLNIGSFVSVPLVSESQWRFLLVIYRPDPYDWRQDQIELLRELTRRIWTRIDQAQAEERLRKSEESLHLAINAANMFTWEVDPKTGQTIYSANFNEVIGFEISPVAEENYIHIYPEDEKFISQATADALQGFSVLDVEHRVINPRTKAVVWVKVQGRLVTKINGETFFIGITQNITERKMAEEVLKNNSLRLENEIADRLGDLKESRDRIQSLLDTTLVQLSILKAIRDENGDLKDLEIILVNKELERETGRADLVGKIYSQEYPGIREVGIFDLIGKTIDTGEPQHLEYFYSYEGFNRWYSCMYVKLDDGVVASNIDITARKQAEDERARNFVLLQQSESLADSGSWDFDLMNGSFVWSDGMYRLFNLEKGLEVRPEIYLQYVTEDFRETARRIVDHIERGDAKFDEIIHIQVGEAVKVVKIKADVIVNAQGNPVRVLGVDLDITATRFAEEKLRQLQADQQLEIFRVTLNTQEEERRRISESLHNGVGQLLYGTRLAMNYLTVKTAVENPDKFNESRAYTTSLLTDSIKDIRRISHELMPTVLAEFGLKAAIKDVCEQLQDGVRFNCRVSPENIKLDNYLELAVFRTVQELMVNIVKHANAAKADVVVELVNSEVMIRVSDDGRGMDKSATGKSGIGLVSIRNKVESLKGYLLINSAAGEGTVVEVRLPAETLNADI